MEDNAVQNKLDTKKEPKQFGILFSLGIFVLGLALIVLINRLFNPTTVLIDNDKDGYYTVISDGKQKDCNDAEKTIFPGAVEIKGDGVDQDCSGEDAPFEFDTSNFSDRFKEHAEFLSMKKIQIYKEAIITPNIISNSTIKSISRRIETTGKFEKAYLYIEASIGEKRNPLTRYDSIYFYFDKGETGGHLLRSKSLPMDLEFNTTKLLYNISDIPTINLPYTDNPEEKRIQYLNMLEVLNSENHGYNRKHYLGAFVSTEQFGEILKLEIGYKCSEKSECSIKRIE